MKWHDIKNELPEKSGYYLVVIPNSGLCRPSVVYFDLKNKDFTASYLFKVEPTYWTEYEDPPS